MSRSSVFTLFLILLVGGGLLFSGGCSRKGKADKGATSTFSEASYLSEPDGLPGVDSGDGTLSGAQIGVDSVGGADNPLPSDAVLSMVEELPVILFDFDSFDIKASEMAKLDTILVPWMRANPTAHIQIEGHGDERGTEEYNLNLGQKRASAVRDYLIAQGVQDTMLHTISYGEERPVDPAQTEAAFTKNRRVQFLVYYTD